MLTATLYCYWLSQTYVERLSGAETPEGNQMVSTLAGLLKLLPFFTLVLPGMAARILFTNEVACSRFGTFDPFEL